MSNLKTELQIFAQLRERIAALYALEPDDEAVIDTATGECSLEDAIAGIIRESRAIAAQAEGLCGIINTMKARVERLDARSDKLREFALWAMQESGLRKVAAPDFTANVKTGKAPLVITREPNEMSFACAPDLVRKKETYAWNKDAIRADLENGHAFDFAYLGNAGKILSVRAK